MQASVTTNVIAGPLPAPTPHLHRVRLFLDLPGLALRKELLQIGRLARAGLCILRNDRALEGRSRIVIDHAKRHRERPERHLDQHMRHRAVGLVVHDDLRRFPVATLDIDHLQHQLSGA